MAKFDLKDLAKHLTKSPEMNKMMGDYYARQFKNSIEWAARSASSRPPLKWHQRALRQVRYNVSRARTWLGEVIAGRSFD